MSFAAIDETPFSVLYRDREQTGMKKMTEYHQRSTARVFIHRINQGGKKW